MATKTSDIKTGSPEQGDALPSSSFDELGDMYGLTAMLRAGMAARDENRVKNRIIAGLFGLFVASMCANVYLYAHQPDPRFIGETVDGRFRDLPTLNDPIYDQKQILEWSAKCVQEIYRLSYVDWQTSLHNNTLCLGDGAREGFAGSLKKIGVYDYLTPELQGNLYAVTSSPELKNQKKAEGGYSEWIVSVPYRIFIDGKQHGTLDAFMTMKIRRVPFSVRADGLWVETYVVRNRAAGQGR